MKVSVIGGGSTYTPELVKGFLERMDSFPLQELWLMDIDPQRLEVVGKYTQRMVMAGGSPFKVVLSTDQSAAITDASYIITQLRVGQMKASRAGFHPIPTQPLPPVCFGLMAQIKSYELLTADAAVSDDLNSAFQPLLANPLGPQADQAEAFLDDLLKTNKPYLPQFWKNSASVR